MRNKVELELTQLIQITTTSAFTPRPYATSVTDQPTFKSHDELHEFYATDEKVNTRIVTATDGQDFIKMTVSTSCANPQCNQTRMMELQFVCFQFSNAVS
jgi:hypothetical protein